MNIENVDSILQLAVLAAGQEDDYRLRQLGPIHLIKYVYIADLSFATDNQGRTFTETNWKFHKFGPWSFDLYERVDPALFAINANKKTFPSDYCKEEWARWSLSDDEKLETISRGLPFSVKMSVKYAVHKFGNATSDLLHYVYSTAPMRNAMPGEKLDFSLAIVGQKSEQVQSGERKKRTARQQKKQRIALKDLQEKNKALLAAKRQKHKKKPLPSPIIYDEVYEKGIIWLDALAGDPIQDSKFEAICSDSIWKSPARTTDDLS